MIANERARNVLGQVVKLHYTTCGPVGSKLISTTKAVPFSPATIRNIMVRLEDGGYLRQPHTSAGRLPTDLGYRAYVEDIRLQSEPLPESQRSAIKQRIREARTAPMALQRTAEYLQEQTELLSFHLPFRESGVRLRHISFQRLNQERLLVHWVARGEHTFETVLDLPETELPETMAEKVQNYYNQAWRDRSLIEIRRQLRGQVSQRDGRWDLLLGKASRLAEMLSDSVNRSQHIDFHGAAALLELPEFQTTDEIKVVFKLLERQVPIHRLIQRLMDQHDAWLMFFIGGEMDDPELQALTVALAKMRTGHGFAGCIGVIGPKRMPYLRALQLLRCAHDEMASLND